MQIRLFSNVHRWLGLAHLCHGRKFVLFRKMHGSSKRKAWPNAGLMLGHCLRRWPNIYPTFGHVWNFPGNNAWLITSLSAFHQSTRTGKRNCFIHSTVVIASANQQKNGVKHRKQALKGMQCACAYVVGMSWSWIKKAHFITLNANRKAHLMAR